MGFTKATMSTSYQSINNLKVSVKLLNFVNDDLLKNTGISPEKFWLGFDQAVHELTPKNKELIKIRENLQKKLMIGISKIKIIKLNLTIIKNF